MRSEETRVPWRDLHEFVTNVFQAAGMSPDDAATEADTLIWANLRGVDSHGVLRIPWYLDNIDKGVMNPKPDIRLLKETPATVLVEADRALGPVVTVYAARITMEKAKNAGIGMALIRNHTHQGAIGYYSQMIAKGDMAGIAIACNPPNMAPYGARVAGVHNSPITICVPGKRYPPLVLDMATSVAAGGKLWLAQEKGIPIPHGWAVDKEGNPTTDPNKASTFLPFAGPKGSGLALLFECLSSIMAGNPLVQPTLSGTAPDPGTSRSASLRWERPNYLPRHNQNSMVAALDIANFSDLEPYRDNVDNLVDAIKSLPRANGFDEIFVPGEVEERTRLDRIKAGIPLPKRTIENLRRVGLRFNVEFPIASDRCNAGH